MIFDKLNEKNVRFKMVDSNKDESDNEIFLEIVFNKALLQDFIFMLALIRERAPRTKINLTCREKQVLKCIAQGKNNEKIAKEINISVHTTKSHLHKVFEKLKVQDRTEAAVKAVLYGLIDTNSLT